MMAACCSSCGQENGHTDPAMCEVCSRTPKPRGWKAAEAARREAAACAHHREPRNYDGGPWIPCGVCAACRWQAGLPARLRALDEHEAYREDARRRVR